MAKGLIGRPFTFTALFLDSVGAPVTVTTPTIEVFYYDETGVRIDVVAAGTTLAASLPAETGRYAHTLTISDTYDTRVQLYGVMRGTDPGSGDTLVVIQEVDLFAEESVNTGLQVSFVKDGDC